MNRESFEVGRAAVTGRLEDLSGMDSPRRWRLWPWSRFAALDAELDAELAEVRAELAATVAVAVQLAERNGRLNDEVRRLRSGGVS